MPPKRPKTAAGPAPVAQLSLFAEEANLARINHAENMWRFYRMEVWPDLLGGALLMRQWGRIGTEGRRRLDPYPDLAPWLTAVMVVTGSIRLAGLPPSWALMIGGVAGATAAAVPRLG